MVYKRNDICSVDGSAMPTRRDWLKNVVWTASAAGLALPAHLLAQPAGGKKVAFLVGVDKYLKPGFRALTCCERDVVQLEGALRELGFSQIEVLLGSGTGTKQATKANIEQALQKLVQQLGQDDLIVVMLSGHGQQFRQSPKGNEDAYFCPVDARSREPMTLVSISYLTDELLAKNVGTGLLLVDACRNAPKSPDKGTDDPEVGEAKGVQGGDDVRLKDGRSILFSCRARQQSYEDSDKTKPSLFTSCVLEALQVRKKIPEGELQQPIFSGQIGHTVLGRVNSIIKTVGKRAGDEREDNGLKMKFVWCPPGAFTMGSPESESDRGEGENQLEVRIENGFWMGKFEVTQEEWSKTLTTTPWQGEANLRVGDKFPASFVSFHDAIDFVQRFTERERAANRLPTGWHYRLPTELQWEYACRAVTKTAYSFGDSASELSTFAWWGGFGAGNCAQERFAHQVGTRKPNSWGLHDMHGNVWEWCQNSGSPQAVVTRGGSWSDAARECRSARRAKPNETYQQYNLGFRVVLTLDR
jgi:sulfatase modifying factor 1